MIKNFDLGGLWQAYAIDAMRGKKPWMCLLAATGLGELSHFEADFDEDDVKTTF